ncbi:hypothetical protein D3C78_828000 [compost metagenome]
MVRITNDQFAIGCRADQQVDTVFVQVRRVLQDFCLYRRGLRQVGEGAVVHAAQTGEQRVLQVEVDLRSGAEHLQAANLRLEFSDLFGQ